MSRQLFKFLAALSALCAALLLILWVTSYFGVWCSLRRADVAYNIISCDGNLIIQRAKLYYDIGPARWTVHHGRAIQGGISFGPTPPTSLFDCFGLVDTLIVMPWDAGPDPREIAASINTTGRSVAVPEWALLLAAMYPPFRWKMMRSKEKREKRRRGFDVLRSTKRL